MRSSTIYPEEIVLWTLAGGVVADPWGNDSVHAGVRSSLLALRNLRQPPADVPAAVPGIMPFSVDGGIRQYDQTSGNKDFPFPSYRIMKSIFLKCQSEPRR